MSRHYSIDTLFSSPTPQAQELERQEAIEAMFTSMQPSRPTFLQQQPLRSPLNQQPTRNISSTLSTPVAQPPSFFPRSQMEAMPPSSTLSSFTARKPTQALTILDAAKRHPVFFTDRLKKAPAGVTTGEGLWASPVARGYVFNDGPGRKESGVKL